MSDWNFYQVFGDKAPIDKIPEVDIVSALQFDYTGNFIAAGDKGGRVVLFEKDQGENTYQFFAEFQSHEPEFDYLKSLEIEEKINQIRWCRRANHSHLLLTTNDKTIKLWKVHDKKVRSVSQGIHSESGGLVIPTLETHSALTATPRRIFSNAHAYHINSISVNSDDETYISADDLRVNLWNLEITDQSFNIVDIKPENMEELSEVITSSICHPNHCNLFMYSTSKGIIHLADTREAALCDENSKVFQEEPNSENESFFTELISSISDVQFTRNGRYIISRDYLTLKIWDVNMETKPVQTIQIHDYLRAKLCDLYESDSIFDKFECCISADGKSIITGSYNNFFYAFDLEKACTSSVAPADYTSLLTLQHDIGRPGGDVVDPDDIDYAQKCLHVVANPTENILSIASNNNMFLFGS